MYWGMAPIPPRGGAELDAADDEVKEALKELGYAEGAREATP